MKPTRPEARYTVYRDNSPNSEPIAKGERSAEACQMMHNDAVDQDLISKDEKLSYQCHILKDMLRDRMRLRCTQPKMKVFARVRDEMRRFQQDLRKFEDGL